MAIIICIRFRSQKAEALNNIWRGPSSFHQSLDISLSGESRERREREWAALMIGIREDKLTSDLTSHPSHPITHNTRPTNNHNWNCRVCGVRRGENLGYIFYHSDLSMFPCDPFVINTRVSSSAIVITCQIQDLICVRYIVTRYDIIIFCVFILPSRSRPSSYAQHSSSPVLLPPLVHMSSVHFTSLSAPAPRYANVVMWSVRCISPLTIDQWPGDIDTDSRLPGGSYITLTSLSHDHSLPVTLWPVPVLWVEGSYLYIIHLKWING